MCIYIYIKHTVECYSAIWNNMDGIEGIMFGEKGRERQILHYITYMKNLKQ